MIIVYITCANKEEAQKISKALLEKRMVGCTNYRPVESMYWWKGEIQTEQEYVLIAKAIKSNYEKIKQEVKKLHSYEVPCILSWDISRGNKAYIDWIKEESR